MDELEKTTPILTEVPDWRAEYEALRNLVVSVLVLVIVLSGSLNIYLLRQAKYASSDLKVARPQVGQMVAEYQRGIEPTVRNMVSKLGEYGKTHPDFQPILNRYNIKPIPAPVAPASTGTPPSAPKSKK